MEHYYNITTEDGNTVNLTTQSEITKNDIETICAKIFRVEYCSITNEIKGKLNLDYPIQVKCYSGKITLYYEVKVNKKTTVDGIPENEIKEFTNYFNMFYGTNGIYPIKDTDTQTIKDHIEILKQRFEFYQFEGDSTDRENLRDLIFDNEELKKAYSKPQQIKL